MNEGEVHRSIGRLEGKMDSLILQLTEHIKKDEEAWKEVGKLKGKIMWFTGVFAGASFFIHIFLKKIGLIS